MAIINDLFEKYKGRIVVESIDFDWDKGSLYNLDFAPAYVKIIIPGEMVEEYRKLTQEKGKSEYPSATKFVKETGFLEKLRKSDIKIINKNWNNIGDVLDFLERDLYSARFQALESKDVKLEIEEIIPTNKAFAA
jgi:hypothetical protein